MTFKIIIIQHNVKTTYLRVKCTFFHTLILQIIVTMFRSNKKRLTFMIDQLFIVAIIKKSSDLTFSKDKKKTNNS